MRQNCMGAFIRESYPLPFGPSNPNLHPRVNPSGYIRAGCPLPYGSSNPGLGDVIPQSTILPSPTSAFLGGVATSPFLYAGIGLLAVFLWSGSQGKARRRSVKTSPVTSALLLTGAAAGGYLAGKYI